MTRDKKRGSASPRFLHALARVLRALLSGLGYAALAGVSVLLIFLAWFRAQPPGDAFAGLMMWFVAAFATLGGFAVGVALSVAGIMIIRRVPGLAWLHRRWGFPALVVVGALTSWGTVEVGQWLQTSPPPPRMRTTVQVPFDDDLGVGVARVGISLTGEGCVGFYNNTSPYDATSYFTRAYALSTPDSADDCNGLTAPVDQTVLAIMYDDLEDGRPPPSSGDVVLQFTLDDENEGAFGRVVLPSLTPKILRAPPLDATIDSNVSGVTWRVRVEGVGDGFAVPVVDLSDREGPLSFALYEVAERGDRAKSRAGSAGLLWPVACESPACERGWYLDVYREAGEPLDVEHEITVQVEVWAFDSDSEPSITVERVDR